ncbi:MAG: TetR/AcrR family transcriptional regulator [Spirochaetes bacterium]|nr:TetR/AcrR family transcriptional regulator [Spirochaetota bacterium]
MKTGKAETRHRLIESAIELFSQNWYAAVSVANICRQAGLSNGIFYKYFPDKESLLKEILNTIVEEIAGVLQKCDGKDMHERIESTVGNLVNYAAANRNLIRVYREGQYHFFEYEQKLTHAYEKCLGRILGGKISHGRYLYAIGGLRFASVRAALYGVTINTEAITHIIEHGIFPGQSFDEHKVFDIAVQPLPLNMEDNTEKRLLAAGKKLFGQQGYHHVNIHDITNAAGFSVGAFYKYFESKESYFEHLIDEVGHDARRFISVNLSPGLNRLEQEMQGMYLFAAFLSIDRWCYNIVREGEFVVPHKAKEYYNRFVDAYKKNTDNPIPAPEGQSIPDYQRSAIEFLLGLPHYFGLEMIFDHSNQNARMLVREIGSYMARGLQG